MCQSVSSKMRVFSFHYFVTWYLEVRILARYRSAIKKRLKLAFERALIMRTLKS